MDKLKYKTNINCGGCIKTVTPYLDAIKGINWSVETANKKKILTVTGDNIESEIVIGKVKEAGFEIEKIKKGLFGF